MTNNIIFFALGRAQDWLLNLLLTTQQGLPQTAKSKMKVNRKEGKTRSLCSIKLHSSKIPVLFSSQTCSHPNFYSLPTHVFCRDRFRRHTVHLFSPELDFSPTEVCVGLEEERERVASEPWRKDTLASGRASVIKPEQIFFMCHLQLEEWPERSITPAQAFHRGWFHPR